MKNLGLPWLWKEKANGGFSVEIDDGTVYGGTIRKHIATLENAEKIVSVHNEKLRRVRTLAVTISTLLLITDICCAWEFRDNPDKYASIGIHHTDMWQGGQRDEVDYNNLGQAVRVNGGNEIVTSSEFSADLRIPIHSNCTLEGSYGVLDSSDKFTRVSGVYRESRNLTGYKMNLGVRFYLK